MVCEDTNRGYSFFLLVKNTNKGCAPAIAFSPNQILSSCHPVPEITTQNKVRFLFM
jgi:hypothetical protein